MAHERDQEHLYGTRERIIPHEGALYRTREGIILHERGGRHGRIISHEGVHHDRFMLHEGGHHDRRGDGNHANKYPRPQPRAVHAD